MKKKSQVQKKVFNATLAGVLPTDYNVRSSEESFKISEALNQTIGFSGRLRFGSKSQGHESAKAKKLIYVPNANVFILDGCKVWYGDWMSDTKTIEEMQKIAGRFDTQFFILREMDGRFLSEPPTP